MLPYILFSLCTYTTHLPGTHKLTSFSSLCETNLLVQVPVQIRIVLRIVMAIQTQAWVGRLLQGELHPLVWVPWGICHHHLDLVVCLVWCRREECLMMVLVILVRRLAVWWTIQVVCGFGFCLLLCSNVDCCVLR